MVDYAFLGLKHSLEPIIFPLQFHVDIINSNYPSDTCFRTSYTRFTC